MNMKASIELFLAAIVFGMGFHIGYGLISFVVWVAAKSLGQADVPILH
jgi:hypothetical protein